MKNRATRGGWWGNSIASGCRKPSQFSCWNATDPNRALLQRLRLETDTTFRQCLAAAAAVLLDLEPDPTQGARHYCTTTVSPAWAQGHTPTVVIGAHRFYTGIA